MLRIENLKLPPGSGDAALRAQVLKVLRLPEERLLALRILRRSIDAREGVHWVYTVEAETANEDAVLRRCRDKRVSRAEPRPAYRLPQAVPTPDCPPVIVGAGPAGLFAALVLARARCRPILLERGRRVEERTADVERFWSTGALDLTSNVQFGEGGRRCVFRRKAEYRHQGHPTPFYFRGAGKVRRTGGHSDRRQAPYRHGLPAHRPEKSAAGAIGRQDGPPL